MILSLATTLSACATSSGSPPSAVVQIPRDCENLAENVPSPRRDEGQNPKAALAQHVVALKRANTNLTATRTCQQHQRERFAGQGS